MEFSHQFCTKVSEGTVTITKNRRNVDCHGTTLKCKRCAFVFSVEKTWAGVRSNAVARKSFQSAISRNLCNTEKHPNQCHTHDTGPASNSQEGEDEEEDDNAPEPVPVLVATEIKEWTRLDVERCMSQKAQIPAEIKSLRAMHGPGSPFFVIDFENEHGHRELSIGSPAFYSYDPTRCQNEITLLPPKLDSQRTITKINRLQAMLLRQANSHSAEIEALVDTVMQQLEAKAAAAADAV